MWIVFLMGWRVRLAHRRPESLDTLQHYARLTIQDLKKEHQRCHPMERDVEG
jgi:hypothetical protein